MTVARRAGVYMNTYNPTSNYWAHNENLLIEINSYPARPSKVVRLGSSYNLYYDYRSEGSGALDFAGKNIWTTGNWGFKDGRGDVMQ